MRVKSQTIEVTMANYEKNEHPFLAFFSITAFGLVYMELFEKEKAQLL